MPFLDLCAEPADGIWQCMATRRIRLLMADQDWLASLGLKAGRGTSKAESWSMLPENDLWRLPTYLYL